MVRQATGSPTSEAGPGWARTSIHNYEYDHDHDHYYDYDYDYDYVYVYGRGRTRVHRRGPMSTRGSKAKPTRLQRPQRPQRPRHRRMLTLTVQGRERISPHFMRVTLGGDDFQHLEQSGYDQAGRFFIPGPDQAEIVLPSSERWMLQLALQSSAKRPRVRTYSIRRFRPEISGFDIEIAVHEDPTRPRKATQATAEHSLAAPGDAADAGAFDDAGDAGDVVDVGDAPGATWALTAEPGDRIAFLDEGHSYAPAPDAAWQLLVGDESALPAILAILERSTDALPAEVFLEVPADADIRHEITAPAATEIHWLPRNEPTMKPGTLALRAVKDARLRPGPFYTWTAGESSLPTGIRRHLTGERGVPGSDIAFRGYWKQGRAGL
jgi:NADPH-dependent ferric siderophore reductase